MKKITSLIIIALMMVSMVFGQADVSSTEDASFYPLKWLANFFEAGVITRIDGESVTCDYIKTFKAKGTDDDSNNDGQYKLLCKESICSFEVVESGEYMIKKEGIVRKGEIFSVGVSEPNQWDIHFFKCEGSSGGDESPTDCNEGSEVGNFKCINNDGYICDTVSGGYDWELYQECQSGWACEAITTQGVTCIAPEPCKSQGESCSNDDQCCGGYDCINGVCGVQEEGNCVTAGEYKCQNGNVYICEDQGRVNNWAQYLNCGEDYICKVENNIGFCELAYSCKTQGESCSNDDQCCGGYDCDGGVCTAIGECTETDSGKDYAIKGTANYGSELKSDNCLDENTLQEYYCVDNKELRFTSETHNCAEGLVCADGACVKPTCSDKEGNICSSSQTCPGQFLDVRDSDRCCDVACKGESTGECVGGEVQFQTNAESKTDLSLIPFTSFEIDLTDIISPYLDRYKEDVKDACCEDLNAYRIDRDEDEFELKKFGVGASVSIGYDNYVCKDDWCPTILGSIPSYIGMEPDCTMGAIILGGAVLLLILLLK